MPSERDEAPQSRLSSPSGLTIELNANGSIRRIDCGDVVLNLFLGNEVEGGPANIYLRRHDAGTQVVPLLGPCSPARFAFDGRALHATGQWQGIGFSLALVLAESAPVWFWHAQIENLTDTPQMVDLVYTQDLALSPYSALRLNEHYVSHYVDHTPLAHPERGWLIASRQNLAANGRHPWTLIGSLRRGAAFATDALQVYGFSGRVGATPVGLVEGLPSVRRQHEHSMVAIQDAPLHLAPGECATGGFFGRIESDHPAATGAADLPLAGQACALPEARWPERTLAASARAAVPTLFAPARLLRALDLAGAEIDRFFGVQRRHEEHDDGRLLSFFVGEHRHVVLRTKELNVLRPHGHILRTGDALTPDETALTSTTWMCGVFHSMVTQGHVCINRFVSTVHGYLGLFRSSGQRVFVELGGVWHLLDLPSAYEMAPDGCRWIYKHVDGLIEVRSHAHGRRHELGLSIQVLAGAPARFLICNHVAIDGDDGSGTGAVQYAVDADGVFVWPSSDSDLGRRFPKGGFRIAAQPGTVFERVGGDELVFADGCAHRQPFVCIVTAAAASIGVRILASLVSDSPDVPAVRGPTEHELCMAQLPRVSAPAASALATDIARMSEILPWYFHNALIHYLAPRGLEQYSGGGWGTRDVCQGPVELLLALGRVTPIRDLLLRVFGAQNPDGDWPQWFTFFERERHVRAGDSHGDIVFWPLLALARYLIASEDAALLDEQVPFFDGEGAARAEHATVWQHAERALGVIQQRRIDGTWLAAFGHGDWNDALQPADPRMRERMCSAWTVTLHFQMLTALARALRGLGWHSRAAELEATAQCVKRDFRERLMPDGVVAGYALFEKGGRVDYLLHPRDSTTGVRYSLLPMIHAMLSDMLSPQEARDHLEIVARHLVGPDGARLFDRPMAYQGGPQKLFQRAESSAFFGREIGLMYMHAHLRYAEALAHMGEAERFFEALCKSNPIGIKDWVSAATLRQANCYYSSSDAAFRDRYQACAEYGRVASGEVALDGGWRVYSSGPGIGLSLIVRSLLGIRCEKSILVIDPVMPRALDGLRVELALAEHRVEVIYQVGDVGCGPIDLNLNGKPLPFSIGVNPYRQGAAEIPMATLIESLTGGGDRLTVRVA